MGSLNLKPIQILSSGDFDKLPEELLLEIVFHLGDLKLSSVFLSACRKLHKFHVQQFSGLVHRLALDSARKSQTLAPTSFHSELPRIINRPLLLFEVSKESNETKGDKCITKLFPPQCLQSWSDGTPIPEDSRVLLFPADENPQELDTRTFQSMIILLTSGYSRDKPYLKSLRSVENQKLLTMKRTALYYIALDEEYLDFVTSYSFDYLCLCDCTFEWFDKEKVHEDLSSYHTKILHIELSEIPDFKNFFSCITFETLIIRYCRPMHINLEAHFGLDLHRRLTLRNIEIIMHPNAHTRIDITLPGLTGHIKTLNLNHACSGYVNFWRVFGELFDKIVTFYLPYSGFGVEFQILRHGGVSFVTALPEDKIIRSCKSKEEWDSAHPPY